VWPKYLTIATYVDHIYIIKEYRKKLLTIYILAFNVLLLYLAYIVVTYSKYNLKNCLQLTLEAFNVLLLYLAYIVVTYSKYNWKKTAYN